MIYRGNTAGEFSLRLPGVEEVIVLPNTLVQAGALAFLQTLFYAQTVLPTTFYLGVCSLSYDFSTTLAEVAATEPTAGGYARMPLVRGTEDWTAQLVGNAYEIASKQVTYLATSNWNKKWRQMFLCSCASGTEGFLIAVSGKYKSDIQTEAGLPPTLNWKMRIRGLGSQV